jgi:general secretion pathway protein J
MRRARPAAAGFTLLEVMLALAIMGFITATIWGTFSQTAKVKQRMESAQERTHTLRLALTRMTRELEMAYLSGSELTFNQERRTMFVATPHADMDELRFSWFGHQRLRHDSPEADSAVVMYYAESDPQDPGVMNLMRRETRRLEMKDPQTIPGEAYILCPNITRLKFSFYDFIKREWREDWTTMGVDGRQYVPTHIRISLTVVDEKGEQITFTSAARLQMTERVDYRPQKS